ncbi:shikimate kinase [Enterococcus sp. LJL98]
MKKQRGIALVGLNGAGKSTLGKYIAQQLDFHFFEVEDFWFAKKHDYQNPRSASEASQLLLAAIQKTERHFIIGGNLTSLSPELLQSLALIVFVDVEKSIRVARVLQRERTIFGELPLTDPRYPERQAFLEFVKNRTADTLNKWIKNTTLPVLIIDGTQPFKANLEAIQTTFTRLLSP